MRRPYRARVQRVTTYGGQVGRMAATIYHIGLAIRRASVYPPIRNLAASLATRALPKDFLGQLYEIYKWFLKHWRYVQDPSSRELLTASPEALYRLVMGADGVGVGGGLGAGDCDCATAALGALFEAIGFRVRIVTTADPWARPGRLFGHVFIQALVPQKGWVTVDPVLYSYKYQDRSRKRFGDTAKWARIAYWGLNGRLLKAHGNLRG
jgi:hypothetical protein